MRTRRLLDSRRSQSCRRTANPNLNHTPPIASRRRTRDEFEIERDEVETPDDLDRNPGIGASKGATMAGADADDIDDLYADGENTFPGDVENDAGRPGAGVDPQRRPRENK